MGQNDSSDLFLRACRRQPVERTPVWFMRQAGRYMKEYRELRARYSLLELCQTPELAAQITLQPIEKLGVDAAIIFADLLLPAQAMGLQLEFATGEGPVLSNPVRTAEAVRQLREVSDGELSYVAEAIRIVCRELNGKVPLIGFCGAPFTVASYMVEGGASRNFVRTKTMMYQHPELWRELMQKLVKVLSEFLKGQVVAGAKAVQIFDSWVGCLCPEDYRTYVLPYSRELIANVASTGVPVIHFGTGTATLLELMRQAGGSVIGVDWRIELADSWQRVGHDVAVQGNLDPVVLLGPQQKIRECVERILRSVNGQPGHIFNLGHGILPETPVENVQLVVEIVQQFSANTPKMKRLNSRI
ncbi:MAG: uroporphyrinogen decarboxylase [Acidobacteria bacterium RIFCSPLOWO2_12_FULL_59_11]|nr:MAG: uroporphyrinogen decarboxylase [Acidobacteria bacterium RIFCSPLOWO2_12_FULL_59_11]